MQRNATDPQAEREINSWIISEEDYSPKQLNLYDCGMFLLGAMFALSMDKTVTYEQVHMTDLRNYFLTSLVMEHFIGMLE